MHSVRLRPDFEQCYFVMIAPIVSEEYSGDRRDLHHHVHAQNLGVELARAFQIADFDDHVANPFSMYHEMPPSILWFDSLAFSTNSKRLYQLFGNITGLA